MPIADTAMIDFELRVHGTYAALGGQSQQTANLLHFKRTLFTSSYNATEFFAAWRTLVENDWLAAVNLQWTMDELWLRCLNDAEDAYQTDAVGNPGTVTGDPLPSYCAMVISRKSAIRGRWANGRSYIAGIAESGTTGNALTAGQLTLLTTLATRLNTQVTTASGLVYKPSIFSPTYSQIAVNPTNVTNTQQASATAQGIIGRMRSRASRVA